MRYLNAIKSDPSILLIHFVAAGIMGIVAGLVTHPTPSSLELYTNSVSHYTSASGDNWTSEGYEAITSAYYSACTGGK